MLNVKFKKIINFFKGIFGSKKQSEEIVQDISTIKSESTNEIVKKTMETNFLEEIKVKKEDSYLLELQNLYECKSMDVCLMTDEEIESLNSLYKLKALSNPAFLADDTPPLSFSKNLILLSFDTYFLQMSPDLSVDPSLINISSQLL